jgi:hypothetical protein
MSKIMVLYLNENENKSNPETQIKFKKIRLFLWVLIQREAFVLIAEILLNLIKLYDNTVAKKTNHAVLFS